MKHEKQKCNYVVIALNKKLQGNLNECRYYAETDTNTKPDKYAAAKVRLTETHKIDCIN